jgi:hypothetical protein
MAADTAKEECDKRTGEYRENEAGKDRDPLHLTASTTAAAMVSAVALVYRTALV